MFKLEKMGVKPRETKYPFHDMKIGDSFYVPIEEADIGAVRVAACTAAKKDHRKVRFAVHKDPSNTGCRVYCLFSRSKKSTDAEE